MHRKATSRHHTSNIGGIPAYKGVEVRDWTRTIQTVLTLYVPVPSFLCGGLTPLSTKLDVVGQNKTENQQDGGPILVRHDRDPFLQLTGQTGTKRKIKIIPIRS